MANIKMVINNDIFENYLNCKYKAYLKLNGNSGNKSEYEIIQNELGVQYKRDALKCVLSAYKEKEILSNPESNCAIEEGKKIIANACISYNSLQSYCDFMEKILGKSSLGAFHYAPILVVEKEKLSKEDKLKIAYSGWFVGKMQNRKPEYGKIVYGKKFKISKLRLDVKLGVVTKLINDLKEYCDNGKSPPFILNRHCQICEFKDSCRSKAVEKDDLSLLAGISTKEIETQNKKGIFTIRQYSYTFRPRRKFRKSYPFNLKALAIREKKIYVYGKPEMPTANVRIYLDVEGDPDRDFYYLVGVVIVRDSTERHYSFWAENPEQEEEIFSKLLNVLKNYSEFKIYHYGSYETKFLQKMRKSVYRENEQIFDKVVENSVNVLSVIYSHIFFPTYSNGLKDIGVYLGFKWSDKNASGIQSLVWRKRWEMNNSEEVKEKLISYNIEDRFSLKKITELIYAISSNYMSRENGTECFNVVYADDLKIDPHRTFKKVDFGLPDLEYINQCAYFDYQRKRIFIRTNKNIRKANLYYKKITKLSSVVNKYVDLRMRDKCPNCGNKKPYRHHHCFKKVYDLNFSKPAGVPRL